MLDREMKMLCQLGILKENFSAYYSLLMLISRKLARDKKCVSDFWHATVEWLEPI